MDKSRIPFAVIGLNYGRWIVDSLLDRDQAGSHFAIAGVCDSDSGRASSMAQKAGVPAMTFEEILADPGIPAVGLFTGPAGRAGLIRQLIRAGKHVMTTKPFERDIQAAKDILREARELGCAVHLNSPEPITPPDLVVIDAWRKTHDLGRPIGCRADTYASYFEDADGTWYDDPASCPVAPVFRIGIYLINDLIRILGEAEAVQVMTSRIRTGRPTPDNAQIGILFRSGAIASVFASLCIDDGQRWSDTLTLNFERGTIYRNVGPLVFGGAESATRLSLLTQKDGTPVTEEIRCPKRSGQYQWEAFHRAINGEEIHTPADTVLSALQVVAAMARAESSGQREPVDGSQGESSSMSSL
ncbi:MAG: hypothetical protein BGO12_19235 [Verrucomicrobia bacterium 61-8]|nr:Gfo/Idh/MocA family oxidoreductase [Verrucomicrobiota bacterium]OJV00890.1 MAG: hypothetical protein BGO12_19235 [Verrucomicrobia bacterium 61-8]